MKLPIRPQDMHVNVEAFIEILLYKYPQIIEPKNSPIEYEATT
jgi:hypothetical protein